MIPYGRQWIDDEDIQAVVEVLQSDWLTTGPKIEEFEKVFSNTVGAQFAVAVSSGTAALHAAMFALGIGSGDEVIVPPLTFAATANCIVYQKGSPVFVDVSSDNLLIDPEKIEEKINTRTKSLIAVDYAGHPCEWDVLRQIAERHNIWLVADACHALGAKYNNRPVGSLADLNIFSFHPVKHITTGEGGMITTNNSELAERMRIFRNHGITTDHRQREVQGSWYYEMAELGYNYRITDFQCALGISQLKKLPRWIGRRNEIAQKYDDAFRISDRISPLKRSDHVTHAYHLYVVRLDSERIGKKRTQISHELRERGVGVNVHYIPVHLHPYYRDNFGTKPGYCPIAEAAYEHILSLPMYPKLTDKDIEFVIEQMHEVIMR